ncbi:MAG: type II secretion system protein [bacterium]|nr:MAG: type II secretion system protein [bacterium]
MPVFTYTATDAQGRLVTGSLDAPDKKIAVDRLQKENRYPISVETHRKRRALIAGLPFKKNPMSRREMLDFTSQMATLLKSGLVLDRCLGILIELTSKEKTREIVRSIQEAVHSGETLSGAMAKHGGLFSRLYIAMVKAGEAGGFLEKIFERLEHYLESRLKLVESVRSAMFYPAILFVAGVSALGILTGYVIPKFAVIFEGMGAELPAATRFLVWISHLFSANYPWILIAVVAAFFFVQGLMKMDSARRRRDHIILKIPLFGSLVQKSIVAQFTRTLGTLLQSGVPILQSLGIVKETVSNSLYADMIEKTAQGVKEGQKMSGIIKESGLFPPLATHMMMVGEESGALDDMMIRMARIYDEEVEMVVKRIITVIEPVMILVMGGVVAFVVVSMLTAIFSINDLPF